MPLNDIIQALDTLTDEELEVLYTHIRNLRQTRSNFAALDPVTEHPTQTRYNKPLDVDLLTRTFAELREGLSEQDLEELEWAMNLENVKSLNDELPT